MAVSASCSRFALRFLGPFIAIMFGALRVMWLLGFAAGDIVAKFKNCMELCLVEETMCSSMHTTSIIVGGPCRSNCASAGFQCNTGCFRMATNAKGWSSTECHEARLGRIHCHSFHVFNHVLEDVHQLGFHPSTVTVISIGKPLLAPWYQHFLETSIYQYYTVIQEFYIIINMVFILTFVIIQSIGINYSIISIIFYILLMYHYDFCYKYHRLHLHIGTTL